MSVAAVLSVRPTATAVKNITSLPRLTKLDKPSRVFRRRELILSKPLFWDSRTRYNTMAGPTEVRASMSDEGVQALEQEALVGGSTVFAAGGIEATLNDMSKWLVAALFGIIILWRHDGESLWTLMGAVLNTVFSTILKRILNQERPSSLRSDPGMPSSHAQSIFYAVAFLNLSMAGDYGVNVITTTLSGLIFILGCYFSWLRVSQQMHTTSQVVVGAAIGSVFSILWFWAWHAFVLKAFTSHLWVRISVVVGAISFVLSFLLYVIRCWVMEEN